MMPKPTILYIDDELFFMQGVIDFLKLTYEVVPFSSGEEALTYLGKCDIKPNLIVLDIMMTNGGRVQTTDHGRSAGLEFVRLLLQSEDRDIPIVCYTVVTDPALHDQLLQMGVKQIVSKPRLPGDLKTEVDKYIPPV